MKEDRLLKWYALTIYGLVLLGVGAAAGIHYDQVSEGTKSIAFDKIPAIEAMLTTALILATFISVRIALTMAREAKGQREILESTQYDAAAPVIIFDQYTVDYDDNTKIIVYFRNVGSEPVLDFVCWASKEGTTARGPSRYWGTLHGFLEGPTICFMDSGTADQQPFILKTNGWNANDGFILNAYYTSRLHKAYVTTGVCTQGLVTATRWRSLTNDELRGYQVELDSARNREA